MPKRAFWSLILMVRAVGIVRIIATILLLPIVTYANVEGLTDMDLSEVAQSVATVPPDQKVLDDIWLASITIAAWAGVLVVRPALLAFAANMMWLMPQMRRAALLWLLPAAFALSLPTLVLFPSYALSAGGMRLAAASFLVLLLAATWPPRRYDLAVGCYVVFLAVILLVLVLSLMEQTLPGVLSSACIVLIGFLLRSEYQLDVWRTRTNANQGRPTELDPFYSPHGVEGGMAGAALTPASIMLTARLSTSGRPVRPIDVALWIGGAVLMLGYARVRGTESSLILALTTAGVMGTSFPPVAPLNSPVPRVHRAALILWPGILRGIAALIVCLVANEIVKALAPVLGIAPPGLDPLNLPNAFFSVAFVALLPVTMGIRLAVMHSRRDSTQEEGWSWTDVFVAAPVAIGALALGSQVAHLWSERGAVLASAVLLGTACASLLGVYIALRWYYTRADLVRSA